MAMAMRSPQIYHAASPRTRAFAPWSVPTESMPHDAHTAITESHEAHTARTAWRPRRKSVDFVQQVEVRDYEVEPFDYSDSAVRTDKGEGQASPQLRALTESPRMQPLKPEGPVGPAPSAPKLLQRPPVRSPHRLPVRSPPVSPAGPQFSNLSPEMPPMESPPMESMDAGIAEQRLNLNRSRGHEEFMFEQMQMAQREVHRLVEEESMRQEWEVQQLVQNEGVRMDRHGQQVTSQISSRAGSLKARQTDNELDHPDAGRLSAISITSTSTEIISVEEILRMGFQEDGKWVESLTLHTPMEVISVENILSMWGAHAPSVENAQAPAAPSPYPSEASTTALYNSSKMSLQEAEESLQRLELLRKVSTCVPLNFRAECQLS